MKYIVICPDGAADWPVGALQQKTPLEAARLPNLDRLAREGRLGRTQHALETKGNGSDVCCMSLLGYDPDRYHTGRAPLEAKSAGIELAADEIAVRCNTVTVEDGVMVDYSAGHITTDESRALIETLKAEFDRPGLRFHPGVQYRHLLVMKRAEDLDAVCVPPHNIPGQPVEAHLPRGADATLLLDLMERSKALFADHPVNLARRAQMLNPASQIWMWGHGRRPELPSFHGRYGVDGAMISAVDLLKSLGLYMGLDVLEVPGITGFTDTDYAAKARYALASLDAGKDLVFIHVEAPDECGHLGDYQAKLEALERIDQDIVAALLASTYAKQDDLSILVCPDHSTPCALKTHASEPVPFVAWGKAFAASGLDYNETAAKQSTCTVEPGFELIARFLQGAL